MLLGFFTYKLAVIGRQGLAVRGFTQAPRRAQPSPAPGFHHTRFALRSPRRCVQTAPVCWGGPFADPRAHAKHGRRRPALPGAGLKALPKPPARPPFAPLPAPQNRPSPPKHPQELSSFSVVEKKGEEEGDGAAAAPEGDASSLDRIFGERVCFGGRGCFWGGHLVS
jgi:hypothetical protein